MRDSSTVASDAAPVVVVGAGPAGLTSALELARLGVPVLVVEADRRVGGLAQTVEYKGFRFDIGGHRFFTKIEAVRDLWRSMLGPELLKRPRLSRIFYRGKLFNYPLEPLNALRNLGLRASLMIVASYLHSRLRPIVPEVSFEDWVTNRFGRTLYKIFFDTYTQKVWGMPGSAISARWAAQRIQNFSLGVAIVRMLAPWLERTRARVVKTLIEEFDYPRLGPGMMWEAFVAEVERLGGRVVLNSRVTSFVHDGRTMTGVEIEQNGRRWFQPASSVISTMPLKHLVASLGPETPAAVRAAASGLKYRDFLTVALVVDRRDVFPDNWIYIHDPSVKVGRIQNFKNWSPGMVPDAGMTCLGLEYFCNVGDEIRSLSDPELVDFAKAELASLGLVDPSHIVDGTVVHAPNAYPVYDDAYANSVQSVREYLENFDNLQTIGRNGTHTYNNQDHSMVMGLLAVRNLLGERHDLWGVNPEGEYLEEVPSEGAQPLEQDLKKLASTQPLFPKRLVTGPAARPS